MAPRWKRKLGPTYADSIKCKHGYEFKLKMQCTTCTQLTPL